MENIYEMCKVKKHNRNTVKCLTKTDCSYKKIDPFDLKGLPLCRIEDYKFMKGYLEDMLPKETKIDKIKKVLNYKIF